MDQRGLKALGTLIAATSQLAHPASAGLRNDIPSCYAANHITPATPLGYTRLIYVLIDQTVGWDSNLEQAILDNLNSNLTPGTKFVIAEFSAFSQGRYLNVIHTGIIENPMPATQIDNTPIETTKIFDACIQDQLPFAVAIADRSVQSAVKQSTSSLAHSDIMSALQSVSTSIAADPASQKLLFLATDGLENSSVTSFYRHDSLRNINPQAEIQKAASAGMFGNFGGSKIFIIGGAFEAGGNAAESYRSPTLLNNLKTFWQLYFRQSNADLIEFGEPALIQPVDF